MKQLDFINKSLREKNEARGCINNVDEAMLEYYRVLQSICKTNKTLPPYSQLLDFYLPSEGQKDGELLFAAVGTGLETYAVYKYLK